MAATPYPLPRELRQTTVLVGNGGRTYGPFDFKIFDTADVAAFVRLSGETSFAEKPVTVAKVSGLPLDHFTVTFASVLPTSARFVVAGMRLANRDTGVAKGTQLDITALEKELSKVTATEQELRRDINRAVKAKFGDPLQDLPSPENESILGWRGDVLANLNLFQLLIELGAVKPPADIDVIDGGFYLPLTGGFGPNVDGGVY